VAKAEAMTSMTETGMLMGTIRYMAPEQFLGEDASPATDLYSLGLVLYELLAGQTPYDDTTPLPTFVYRIVRTDAPPPSHFNPSLPPVVDLAVQRAIARKPEDRYADCGEMAEALRFLLEGLDDSQRSTPCGIRAPAVQQDGGTET